MADNCLIFRGFLIIARGESWKWGADSGEWRVESGEWRVESEEWGVDSGEGRGTGCGSGLSPDVEIRPGIFFLCIFAL